ncbi:hypothetical protein BC351_19130 [Paenibacillus ferrarius]|uniref:Lipoprotein n=1 Tax=Paenibacillus ferrarius TaxID=1469647 RepID=A0A1V4HPL7_9BACL|nr:hypothetical protein [Paenibacillus ferrarius]OPH60024.1 hypothetical protein BC351_19130 [Paenibacillus ferrarius]
MKRWKLFIVASVFLTFMMGCEREAKPLPEQYSAGNSVQPQPTASPTSLHSEPPTYVEDGVHAVQITLEPRGFLKAPVMTGVADSPQKYAIVFRENMNRLTVEEALLRLETAGEPLPAKPELRFEWQTDKEVYLTVSTQSIKKSDYPSRGYSLDVNGALTNTGQVLRDAPIFRSLVWKPSQLWRVSAEDGRVEKLSSLSEPFHLQALADSEYMLASQFLEYCECDKTLPKLYSVYDVMLDTMTTYPVPLMTQYKGQGNFTIDTRGFFYEQPKTDETVPLSSSAYRIHIDGYVHGAKLSHDRKHVLLAIGKETQEDNLDFVIYDLVSKKAVTMSKILIGRVLESQVSSAKIPVDFQDDGASVFTYMYNDQNLGITEYRYEWQTGKFEQWKPPVADQAWSGFLASDDSAYRYYYNGGMYRGSEKIQLPDRISPLLWLKGTHNIAYTKEISTSPHASQTLELYNVDENKSRTILNLPPGNHDFIGGSKDGSWIYVFTPYKLG